MLLVPFLWLGTEPALACSCVARTVPELVGSADLVATGRLDSSRPTRGGMELVHSFTGIELFKGEPLPTFDVRSAALGASCGLEGLEAGRRYLVFTDADDGVLTANLCGGTRRATPAYVDRVEEVTGPGALIGVPTGQPTRVPRSVLVLLDAFRWWS